MAYPSALFLIAIILGALLIAALLFRRDNRNANLLLCLILAAALLYQYSQMDRLLNPLPAPAYIWGTGFVVSLLIPTLVFLYVLVLTVPGFRWRSSLLVHFIPALVGLGVVAFAKLVLMRYAFAYDPDFRAWFRFFCIVFDVIISGLYFFASYRQIQDYRSQMELFFSQLRRVRLQWLRILLLIVVLPWLIQVFDVLSGPSVRLEYIMVPLITALFLLMGFFGLRQSVIFAQDEEWPNLAVEMQAKVATNEEESKAPGFFSEEKLEEWRRKIEKLMAEQKPYLDPELRLGHLASAVGLKPYHVSEILNRGFRCNFYDYINRYRVEEAKRRLRDPAFTHMNILGIATDSGFNSKSVFNETFRKFTGATPSTFRGG